MTYRIDYDAPAQATYDAGSVPVATNPHRLPKRRRSIIIPSMLKTGLTLTVAAAAFFSAEIYGPDAFKPSRLAGTFDARLVEAAKAAELQQQARYEPYIQAVKLANDQNLAKYQSLSTAVLQHYSASYERSKMFASGLVQMQTQYMNSRLQQTQSRQSADTSIVNYARIFGRFANLVQPGSGDSALSYADGLSHTLDDELTIAAQNGKTLTIDGWDTGLASLDELRTQIEALKPVPMPAPPMLYASSLLIPQH